MQPGDTGAGGDERTRFGRRPFLWGVGAAGASSLCGPWGTVTAQDGEWTHPSDPYYALLTAELEAMGLPPAEFVHADTETGTRGQYWASRDDFEGSAAGLTVTDGVPFSTATRFTIEGGVDNPWNAQFRTASWSSSRYRSVESGQVMLGVAYLRAPEGSGQFQYMAQNQASSSQNSLIGASQFDLGPSWERYYFPIEFDAATGWEEWSTQFWFGFGSQTVDVGGIALLDFGTEVSVGDLPSGTASTDAYYDSLRADLLERGVGLPSFVYADTEAGTHESLLLEAGDYGSVTAVPDLNGSDVPFSRASRFEITEAPAEPHEVQVRGDIGREISAGDVLLGVAYLRAPDGDATVEYHATNDDTFENDVVSNAEPTVGPEWERQYVPIEYGVGSDAGQLYAQLQLGFAEQTVDVGGFALLYFGGDTSVDALPSGVPGDAVWPPEEWPDVDDPYYAGLVDELRGMGLPPAAFRYGETESATMDAHEVFGVGDDGPGTLEEVAVGGEVPFAEAKRLEVGENVTENWDVSVRGDVTGRAVEAGDVLLGVVYLRTPDGAQLEYQARYEAEFGNEVRNDPSPAIGTEWQRYFFRIEYGVDASPGNWWTEIWAGYPNQTLEFGGLALLDFGSAATLADLPTWEGELEEEADEEEDEEEDAPETDVEGDANDEEPETDDDDDVIPGFGAIPGLVALAGAGGYALSRLEGRDRSE